MLIVKGGNTTFNAESGFQEVIVDSMEHIVLNINLETKSDIFLKIKNAKNITINTRSFNNSNSTLLIWNDSKEVVVSNEEHDIEENSYLKLAYADLSAGDVIRKTNVNLIGKNAEALVKSAILCKSKKHYDIKVENMVPHTIGNMENYAVSIEGGNLKIDAVGKIAKGAYKSENHQTSRGLCFDEKQHTQIKPDLFIDENDVLASHAASVGRVDEMQMVYMQSRGLTIKQIMSLISVGYLLPIATIIENEKLREELSMTIESQVEKECLK